MTALYIIAGITAFFTLILSLNASVRVVYGSSKKNDKGNMKVYAKIGFYKINIIPVKPAKPKKIKKTKPKKEKSEKSSKSKKDKPEKSKEEKKFTIPEIFDVIKNVGNTLLKRLKKNLHAKIYGITIILGSEDAEKTALLYGTAIQSAYYLYEFLDNNFKINMKTDGIKIIPDFSKAETSVEINVKFYIKLWNILKIAVVSAIKAMKFWNNAGKTEI